MITGSGPGAGVNNLGAGPADDPSARVRMEDKRSSPAIAAPGPGLAGSAGGGTGRIVLDSLRPPATGEVPFDRVDSPQVGASSVTLNLATQRAGGQMVRVPGTGRNAVPVFPRDIGNPVAAH